MKILYYFYIQKQKGKRNLQVLPKVGEDELKDVMIKPKKIPTGTMTNINSIDVQSSGINIWILMNLVPKIIKHQMSLTVSQG